MKMSKSKNHNKNRYDDNFDDEDTYDARKDKKPRRQKIQNLTKIYLDHADDEEYEEVFSGKR